MASSTSPSNPASSSTTNQNQNDDDDATLSEQLSESLQLDSNTQKQTAFEYLCVMYILQIRHQSWTLCGQHLAIASDFKNLLDEKTVTQLYCVIDEETPISSQCIEAIFIDRFQKNFIVEKTSFKYLLQCYERCIEFQQRIERYWSGIIAQSEQTRVVQHIQICILTFCGILLTTPDLTTTQDFMQSHEEFLRILSSPPKGRDFPKQFLSRLFEHIEDDVISDVVDKPMSMLKQHSMQPMRNTFSSAVNTLIKLSTVERFALFLQSPTNAFWIPHATQYTVPHKSTWRPAVNANKIVFESVLGGFLHISFESADLQPLFLRDIGDVRQRNTDPAVQQRLQSVFAEYRLVINGFQDEIYTVFNNLVRIKNKQCRESTLRLLSFFLFVNLNRGKMHFDPQTVSQDGFVLNLNYVLLQLCEPIIQKNMLNKVDARYFLIDPSANYMTWENATRLACSVSEVEQKQTEQNAASLSFGFTSEVFCLTLESLHLGLSCVLNKMRGMQRQIDHLTREIRNNPMTAVVLNMHLKPMETRLMALIAHSHDPRFMLTVARFYGFFCRWLLYLSQQANAQQLLSIIPEYYIEDFSRFFNSFLRQPTYHTSVRNGQCPFNRDELIQCLIYLMSSRTPIRNIYQRACLCEVLLPFLPPKVLQSHHNPSIEWHPLEFAQHEFNTFVICQQDLLSTLLTLYTEVERTGAHSQFYDKFRFRTIITIIMKFLFAYPLHQNKLTQFSQSPSTQHAYINFLNMLINDLIYCLDHGFDGLTDIRQLETQPEPDVTDANPQQPDNAMMNAMFGGGGNQPPNAAVERQETLAQTKAHVRHFMELANSSIGILMYVCDHTTASLMDDLILPRIAVMVSVYIDRLAHGSDLRVKGNLREDYNFNARFLLTSVVHIFNRLCADPQHQQLFLDAIVEDEAHFRHGSYEKAIAALRNKQLMSAVEIDRFEEMLNTLLRKFEEKKNVEHMLGDIPTRYLDPIMQTLMTDPVVLGRDNTNDPNRFIMDRRVIERHLMNNPNNPFNRKPLSRDDLVPDVALKKEIDDWIQTTIADYKKKEAENSKNENDKDNDEEKTQ